MPRKRVMRCLHRVLKSCLIGKAECVLIVDEDLYWLDRIIMKEWQNMKKHPIGGSIDRPATSLGYKTGTWRTSRPITDNKKCIMCGLCVPVCPYKAIEILF